MSHLISRYRVHVRRARVAVRAIVLGCTLASAVAAQAAIVCSAPGTSGSGTFAGAVNDYWAGSGSPGAGATSITLGARGAGGAGNTIASGDLVLLIQVQDADINSNNGNNYGSGTAGPGSGSTNVNNAGRFEYVRATNTVGGGGGTLNFTPALSYSYRTRGSGGTNGQSRWQAIRVPQYASATANGVTAPAWDGTTGGVVVLDVQGALTLSGASAIDVAGRGFRGGAGRTLAGGGGANTDWRTNATVNNNGAKGEGIAGTPRYVNDTSGAANPYNAAPVLGNTGVEGYPNGSNARGAPGNAGGGGTDGDPAGNSQNTGGGGGSSYGAGGAGGNAWNTGTASGGRGGAAYSGTLAFNRVFMGGGGGAGSTNNGTSDTATYSAPPGLPCNSGALCSSGAAGGGIIIIRAGSLGGGGLIDARGSDAYNVANDGGGGGGAGGSVVLQTYTGGSATVDASGGNGGNAWRNRTSNADRHGPGGGGGGGFIAYSPSVGLALSASFNAGLPGRTSNNDTFGSTSGSGGLSAFDVPSVPGATPGAFCPPAIKAVRLFTDGGLSGQVDPNDVIEYTVIYRNGSSSAVSGFNITDALPAGLSFAGGSLAITPSGGAGGGANGSYNGGASTSLLASAISLPAGGIIQATLRASLNAASGRVCGNLFNQANSVQTGGEVLGLTDNADNAQNSAGLPVATYISQTPFGTGGATDPTGVFHVCPASLTKLESVISDPHNGTSNPKHVPGAIVEYTVLVSNPGGAMDSNSVRAVDPMPAGTALYVNDIGGAGSGPVAFQQGATASGLSYTFTSLASGTDDLEFSNNGGSTYAYVPTPGSNGCDAAVTHVRVSPKGVFASGLATTPAPSFQLRFRVCVK